MNLGKLKNMEFLEHFKEHGYTSKTQLIDEALAFFQKVLKQRERRQWKTSALTTYAKSNPKALLESLEGEDFE